MKISDKDKKFLLSTVYALGAIYVVAHLLMWFYVGPVNEANAQASRITPELKQEVIGSLDAISGIDLRQKIRTSDKPVLLKLYASWCGYCRKAIPYFVELQKKGQLDHLEVVFVSIDREPQKLIQYIGQNNYHKYFIPYVYQPERQGDIRAVIQSYGLSFNGGIPYIALIDTDGKLITEVTGTSFGSVTDEIKKLKK